MKNSSASDESISTKPDSLQLAQFREVHRKADLFSREVQGFIEEAGIPAINELRYAGYHLINALGDDGSVAKPSELIKAINHAHRACYEAAEAGITTALDQISSFKDEYSDLVVSAVLPQYTEIMHAAKNAQAALIAESDHDGGRADVDHLISHFRVLVGHCHILDISRDELNKTRRREARDARRFLVGTVIAIATLVAGAIAAWYAYVAVHPPHDTPAAPHSSAQPPAAPTSSSGTQRKL